MITWDEFQTMDRTGVTVLDTRSDVEWSLGHIEGAVHIPDTVLRSRIDELDRDQEYILYCAKGRRAYGVDRILKQHGIRSRNLTGGWLTYQAAVEKQDNPLGAEPEVTIETEPILDMTTIKPDYKVDAIGLQCPGPIMSVYKKMQDMTEGETVRVQATDPGFRRDIGVWAEHTGNTLVGIEQEGATITALLRKGGPLPELLGQPLAAANRGKTMVVFSGDMDKALAAFIIANGAASMGQQVTMFFTFWGLNILRKKKAPPIKKSLVERMFGWMMPKGADATKLSKLNMGGAGTAMMKAVMRSKNIDSLPMLIESAMDAGVKIIGCQMTMEMMGIHQEELLDGIEFGGVATYIGETDKASATLFI